MNDSQNNAVGSQPKYPWLWDTDDDNANARFEAALSGSGILFGSLKKHEARLTDYGLSSDVKRPLQKRGGIAMFETRRAMARLIDYAPEAELKRLLPLRGFVELWPAIAGRIRSQNRKAEMEALYQRLKQDEVGHG